MTKKKPQCSPPYLETTTNLVWKGADVYSTANGISVPSPRHGSTRQPQIPIPGKISDSREKGRNTPVIWEARRELALLGLTAVPVRGGGLSVPDILAWDQHTLFIIAVRRVRSQDTAHEVAIRHQKNISALRSLDTPEIASIQLWIKNPHAFQIYDVLKGGLMFRGYR
jgi:hypothetical protein